VRLASNTAIRPYEIDTFSLMFMRHIHCSGMPVKDHSHSLMASPIIEHSTFTLSQTMRRSLLNTVATFAAAAAVYLSLIR
jgi:hypothetical protein